MSIFVNTSMTASPVKFPYRKHYAGNNVNTPEIPLSFKENTSNENISNSNYNLEKYLKIGGALLLGGITLKLTAPYVINSITKSIANKIIRQTAPAGNINLFEAMLPNNFSKIKFLDKLNTSEKESLRKTLLHGDVPDFFTTITGAKPACLIGGWENIKFLSKIKNDLNYGAKFDFFAIPRNISYIFNKEKVMEIISQNKELYTSRMGIDKNSTVEVIYNALVKNTNNVLDCTYRGKALDIVGLTLGYPKMSSMIFHLEHNIKSNPTPVDLRKNVTEYKKALLQILHGKNSPYKDLNAEEFAKLESAIKNYKGPIKHDGKYYQFVQLVEEPGEMSRIKENINSFEKNFTIQSLM